MIKYFYCIVFFLIASAVFACTCPPTSLSKAECDKYEIIFRGKVLDNKDCGDKPGEAIFEVLELFKGNATKEFKVLYKCGEPCSKNFQAGEEWIIYSRYGQMENAAMDWCSRSRKFFKHDKEDYYFVLYGNDYDTELNFLRTNLGLHRLLEKKVTVQDRNIKYDTTESAIIVICSVLGLLLFYYLFNRFFK